MSHHLCRPCLAWTEEIVGRWCRPMPGISQSTRDKVCTNGATVASDLMNHHTDDQRKPEFVGFHSGAGYPKGAPKEVVLKPEDILEVIDMLGPSFKAREAPGETE